LFFFVFCIFEGFLRLWGLGGQIFKKPRGYKKNKKTRDFILNTILVKKMYKKNTYKEEKGPRLIQALALAMTMVSPGPDHGQPWP
jgi:hypothetical protein